MGDIILPDLGNRTVFSEPGCHLLREKQTKNVREKTEKCREKANRPETPSAWIVIMAWL